MLVEWFCKILTLGQLREGNSGPPDTGFATFHNFTLFQNKTFKKLSKFSYLKINIEC